jgi:hypothetical protein
VEKSCYATGLLSRHWGKVGGRDALARLTGIRGTSLSGYNTGRLNLGERNARKIAEALDLTLLDLGAPPETAPELAATILDHLESLAAAVEANSEMIQELVARVVALEQRRGSPRRAGGEV